MGANYLLCHILSSLFMFCTCKGGGGVWPLRAPVILQQPLDTDTSSSSLPLSPFIFSSPLHYFTTQLFISLSTLLRWHRGYFSHLFPQYSLTNPSIYVHYFRWSFSVKLLSSMTSLFWFYIRAQNYQVKQKAILLSSLKSHVPAMNEWTELKKLNRAIVKHVAET